jgi:hypothetical protein
MVWLIIGVMLVLVGLRRCCATTSPPFRPTPAGATGCVEESTLAGRPTILFRTCRCSRGPGTTSRIAAARATPGRRTVVPIPPVRSIDRRNAGGGAGENTGSHVGRPLRGFGACAWVRSSVGHGRDESRPYGIRGGDRGGERVTRRRCDEQRSRQGEGGRDEPGPTDVMRRNGRSAPFPPLAGERAGERGRPRASKPAEAAGE